MKKVLFVLAAFIFTLISEAQQKSIYWNPEVPAHWNGKWDTELLTAPEKTDYYRTSSCFQVLEYLNLLRWRSEYIHTFNMYTSQRGNTCPVAILANPRITSVEEARNSGKPVIYLQANIHPPEAEGKEALLMVMRDILLGDKGYLLDNQIIICCPNFNVDGNDTWTINNGTPDIIGSRRNAGNYDLNRDAIKLETQEVKALYSKVLNPYDPVLFFDAHAMELVRHGYANAWATSTVPTAHKAPRDYIWETLLPELRNNVRDNFNLEMFSHCMFDKESWPPTKWSHDLAWWSNEPKFIANYYGLRNRMSILVETPGSIPFERKIYAQYAFIHELLEYTNRNGEEMLKICKDADKDVSNEIRKKADGGKLTKYIDGKYESYGKIDVLAYKNVESDYLAGSSVKMMKEGTGEGEPSLIRNVENITKPVGVNTAIVPRGYIIPKELSYIVDKLRIHNIAIETLKEDEYILVDQYIIDSIVVKKPWSYRMVKLKGEFESLGRTRIEAGSFIIDLAQPLGNLAFYCLEPETESGFVAWDIFNGHLKENSPYPVLRYFNRK